MSRRGFRLLATGGLLVLASCSKQEPPPPTTPAHSVRASAEASTAPAPPSGAPVAPAPPGPGANVAAPAKSPAEEAAALKQEAVTVAGEVAAAYPDDPLTYALLGSAFYNTGRSDEAGTQLKRCLELRPDMVEAYDILARIAYEKGDPEETIRLCIEALKRGPATSEVANRLGRAQMDLGRTEEAVRTLQQAVGLPDATSEGWYLLGQAHMQAGDFLKAKQAFLQTIERLPDHTQAFFGLFTACQRLGLTEEAGRHREQFGKLEAGDRKSLTDRSAQEDTLTGLPMVRETVARTIFGAAQIHRMHEQQPKAAALYRRAAWLDAANPMYRSTLEALYLQVGDPAGGVAAFEALAAEQPGNSLNFLFLGRLQVRLERFDAAERSFHRVQQLDSQWPEGFRALAELYLRTNRKLDQARLLAEKAVSLDPTDAHYYWLAVARAQNQDRPGALDAIRRALALNPNDARTKQLEEQLRTPPQP